MEEQAIIATRIRLKAHDLFMQYGIRSVSMDDIASNLGMSKKTIYLHFVDKDALVKEVIVSILEANKCHCHADVLASKNAVHEIFLAIDFMMEMFSKMNPAIIFEMRKYHPEAFTQYLAFKNEYIYSIIETNILRGIAEGLYRDDLKVEVIARFRVASMMLSFNPEFHSTVKYDISTIEEELIVYFLFGMVSPKGYKLTTKYLEERKNKK